MLDGKTVGSKSGCTLGKLLCVGEGKILGNELGSFVGEVLGTVDGLRNVHFDKSQPKIVKRSYVKNHLHFYLAKMLVRWKAEYVLKINIYIFINMR